MGSKPEDQEKRDVVLLWLGEERRSNCESFRQGVRQPEFDDMAVLERDQESSVKRLKELRTSERSEILHKR